MSHAPKYNTWKIKKRSGGHRTIESPDDVTKVLQRESADELAKVLKVSPFAHGFQPYKNIATCALPHVGKDFLGSIDISDFFPSIKKELFLERAVKEKWKANQKDFDIHFHNFLDGKDQRLPQGAPGSPFLSNAYLLTFDWRMAWLCHEKGVDYTRYADDLCFSGPNRDDIVKLIGMATRILENEYTLKINKKKTKIMPKSRRMLCVGIVVNEKLNLKRETRKNLRAEVHNQVINGKKLSLETQGRLAFQEMIRNNSKTTHSSTSIISSIKVTRALAGRTK
jgi:retron-type reverse transcriptase